MLSEAAVYEDKVPIVKVKQGRRAPEHDMQPRWTNTMMGYVLLLATSYNQTAVEDSRLVGSPHGVVRGGTEQVQLFIGHGGCFTGS